MSGPSVDIIPRFVDNLLSLILGELGKDDVLAVFTGGSVARGEVSYRLCDGGVDIYSDVDLYVVVGDDVSLEDARNRSREAVSGVPLVGDGYRFFRSPDIGVYSFADLAAQPARPGTVGLDENHVMLYGDSDIPVRAAARIGSDIAVEEALYLLENRLIELAEFQSARRRQSTAATNDGYYAFVVCKTGLDVATAALVARGMYTPHRAEGVQWLTDSKDTLETDANWTSQRLGVVTRCAEAIARMPSADWSHGVLADGAVGAVVSAALTQWNRIAARSMNVSPPKWSKMVLTRCYIGDYINNLRKFRAMNTRCRFKQRGALAAGIHLSRYSPLDALRLSGLTEYLSGEPGIETEVETLKQTLGAFLDRLTRECGFVDGSLAERSCAMYRVAQ